MMNWQNLEIIFTALIHCPFFIWFVIALVITQVFRVEDPKFKEMK